MNGETHVNQAGALYCWPSFWVGDSTDRTLGTNAHTHTRTQDREYTRENIEPSNENRSTVIIKNEDSKFVCCFFSLSVVVSAVIVAIGIWPNLLFSLCVCLFVCTENPLCDDNVCFISVSKSTLIFRLYFARSKLLIFKTTAHIIFMKIQLHIFDGRHMPNPFSQVMHLFCRNH